MAVRSIIEDKFNKFLWIDKIKYIFYDRNKKILGVNFNIWWIWFSWYVVMPDNYKLVITSILAKKGKEVKKIDLKEPIKLEMIGKNRIKFNEFKLTPLEFLKKIDEDAVKKYENFVRRK